jgi:CHAT domain-containing protein
MAQKNHDPIEVRRYLLEPLAASEKESIEHRLLADEEFQEEFEIIENQLIDEYLGEELSATERQNFERYFLAHDERRKKLEAGRVLKRYLDAIPSSSLQPISPFAYLWRWVQRYLFPPPLRIAVAVMVVLVIGGVVLYPIFMRQSDLQKGLLALNEAYRSERPIEARISGQNYAEFISTRGTAEPANVNIIERDRAYIYLSQEYEAHPNAASAHALGKYYLLQRDPEKAIQYLERASAGDPNDAQINADLGAAYFEKGKRDAERPASNADLGRSIVSLDRALEINPNLLEALFNRAIVYEYQGLDHLAEADLRSYVQKDRNSRWTIEAPHRLEELEKKKAATKDSEDKPVDSFVRLCRTGDDNAAWEIYKSNYTSRGNSITKALLDDYLAESPNFTQHVDILNYLGQLELRRTQDAYTVDLLRVYGSASPERLVLLGQARKQMQKGYDLFAVLRLTEAREILRTARDAFAKLADLPETLVAEAALAHVATLEPDLVKAQELFAHIIPQIEQHNYTWLFAQTLSRRAHMQSNLSSYSRAISDATRSLGIFQQLDDPNGTLGNFIQLASYHYSLNDVELSFSYIRRALATSKKMRAPPGDIWAIHIATSLNLTALKLYRAALDYQTEALRIAVEMDRPLLLSRTYQNIGITYACLQLFEPALDNLRLAYDQGKRIAGEPIGWNMMANASLKLGDFYRASGDPASALTAYDESSRLYEQLKFFHYSYAAHKGKFLSYLAQQNDALAAQELQQVLVLFDEYRQRIVNERQKTHFFDREQDIYDLAIDFTHSRLGDQRRAFEYSEISRARNLRELMAKGAQVTLSDGGLDLRSAARAETPQVRSLSATEIEQHLPAEIQLVQLAMLEKKLLIWHVSKAGIVPTEVEIESTKLTELIAITLSQIRKRDEAGANESLKHLYHLIIEPIKGELDPDKVLCLVPDKALHYLPWSALISSSGRFLFQDFRLMISPSTTILIDSTNKARARASSRSERLLAVGNPAFDRKANPDLANLPGAEREVQRIASLYPSPHLLVGPKATRKSVLNRLGQADVIHFAAHFEVDPLSTLSSKLLLAQPKGERSHAEESGLTAGDIYGLNLTRARLVVLSGCKTAIERDFGGEGPIGFARSFLVAGVPVVVASLWPVDSDATSLLMIEFHRFRREKSTVEALMRAQEEIMMRPRYQSPYYWAGFMVVGGYAAY